MISWSKKRQLVYFAIVLAFVVLVIALPTFLVVYKAPTCSDGKQNQGERGVDCGGSCPRLCQVDALSPIVLWQRPFRVSDGVWNAVAYIENPNINSGAFAVPYIFKLYDADNLLIFERRGSTFISPHKTFAVFEGGIATGLRTPTRALFEFLREPVWVRGIPAEPDLKINEKALSFEGDAPKLTAKLVNTTLRALGRVEVVAILYGEEGNAIGASRTVVDNLEKDSVTPLVFTWPEPFGEKVARIETIVRLMPR